MLAICQLKRANSQFSIQLYHLSLFLCQGRGPSGRMYIPYPIQLLYLHITLLSDNLLTHSYADEFSVYCSNVDQIAEALTAHSSNIKEWADEAISAPNPPSLYSPLNSHNLTPIPKVTLNNSILPLERTPWILGVTIDTHFVAIGRLLANHQSEIFYLFCSSLLLGYMYN